MAKKPSALPPEPLTEAEIEAVITWLKNLGPKDQRILFDMAKINDSPSRKIRGSVWAGMNRGQF